MTYIETPKEYALRKLWDAAKSSQRGVVLRGDLPAEVLTWLRRNKYVTYDGIPEWAASKQLIGWERWWLTDKALIALENRRSTLRVSRVITSIRAYRCRGNSTLNELVMLG